MIPMVTRTAHSFSAGSEECTGQTTPVASERNLLDMKEGNARFLAEDITVHEWAHTIETLWFDDETRIEWLELLSKARGRVGRGRTPST